MTEQHIGLISGGLDSAVAADVAVRFGPVDLLVYLDTTTDKTQKNRQYVERLADWIGVPLWTLRTGESYVDAVKEYGFPGSSRHSIYYRLLKERSIQKLAAVAGDDLVCWTGVRRQESRRRMRNVDPSGDHDGGRWSWRAPIADWSKYDCRRYIKRFEIPSSPLWDKLGRSADCWCGAFAAPEETIDAAAAGCPEQAYWIDALEHQVETGDKREVWGHSGLTKAEVRADQAERDDEQLTLCSGCQPLAELRNADPEGDA